MSGYKKNWIRLKITGKNKALPVEKKICASVKSETAVMNRLKISGKFGGKKLSEESGEM